MWQKYLIVAKKNWLNKYKYDPNMVYRANMYGKITLPEKGYNFTN